MRVRMHLDQQLCSRARLARDARFDGKFYIAVLSTRIYCRPICPSRTSKEENVRYFPTAAAAAEAGFRPCLRCRPECSPGTPASIGTSNTVARALRLIGETGLEEGGVECLADRLGVGSRHLRRLFIRHLGATPTAVAQTRRLQFAKKLIDETTLPMTEVAFASGFGCVRRFNAAISETYQRTPTQIRGLGQHAAAERENTYLFRLNFRPPLSWNSILAFLADHSTPGVELVDSAVYRRSISVNGSPGYFEVSLDEPKHALLLRIDFADPRSLFSIIERIRRMFDLNADWAAIVKTLRADPALARALEADPGLRVPGCWSPFELATLSILGQRLITGGAPPLAKRIINSLGKPFSPAAGLTHLFPGPEVLADADLVSLGVPRKRAEAIQKLSQAVLKGRIQFEFNPDTDSLLTRLAEISGMESGAAQYISMRAFGEPDAFPSVGRDLVCALNLKNSSELKKRSEAWRPWRSYAVIYAWNMLRPKTRSQLSSACAGQQD